MPIWEIRAQFGSLVASVPYVLHSISDTKRLTDRVSRKCASQVHRFPTPPRRRCTIDGSHRDSFA
jgi:hypothetical protein